MKKIISGAFILMLFGSAVAGEKEKTVESNINDVTLFLQGLKSKRKAKIYVDKGITKVIVTDVTQNSNKNDIQVKRTGNFVILDVSHRMHYPVSKTPVNSGQIPEKIQKEMK